MMVKLLGAAVMVVGVALAGAAGFRGLTPEQTNCCSPCSPCCYPGSPCCDDCCGGCPVCPDCCQPPQACCDGK
jgi:hypothetical protein